MQRTTRFMIFALVWTMALLGCWAEPKELVVFLVRHVEDFDQGRDPKPTPAGIQRAAVLAELLADAKIEQIHSSDYFRTRDTAAPTAEALGLPVALYDPRDLPALADQLRASGGRHLVVGHSNTTPAMVGLLGGEPGPEIDEAGEFDRLYIVTIAKDGSVRSAMKRYGTEVASTTLQNTVQDLAWLAGCWASPGAEPGSGEQWSVPAGGTLFGISRTVRDSRTVAFETMQIVETGDGRIEFVANPSGQAGARFVLVQIGVQEVVFENREHDFPQRILYRLTAGGNMVARIEGEQEGRTRAVDFPMDAVACDPAPDREAEADVLLALHEGVLAAHRNGDLETWMTMEGDGYVSANNGKITFPSAAERRAGREPYLAATTFTVYRDLKPPVVRVSDDGTLGWVIAEVEVRGMNVTEGVETKIETIWAWIELYEKQSGAWKAVGNVSNRRP